MLIDSMRWFFFFNDTATTEIYTLSLHDALPISRRGLVNGSREPDMHRVGKKGQTEGCRCTHAPRRARQRICLDRKSTRLNSSHSQISYAVFCLKKKNIQIE